MASSLLALLDDIATVLDDVAVMTKIAAKKSAGVLGDDLALNAQQVAGVNPDRELPVVWAVAKGSFINKLILVPIALAINVFLPPWVTIALLMVGGAFLCFEGFEKIAHKFLHDPREDAVHKQELINALEDPKVNMVQFEKDKIKGAIRTDFILSAEIIVITLGTMTAATVLNKALVLTTIAIAMTIGVYGLVAGIVKLDDLGLYWSRMSGGLAALGRGILAFAPRFMKVLSFVGTAAMFLVGGPIVLHGIPQLWKPIEAWLAGFSGISNFLLSITVDGLAGIIVGGLIVGVLTIVKKLKG